MPMIALIPSVFGYKMKKGYPLFVFAVTVEKSLKTLKLRDFVITKGSNMNFLLLALLNKMELLNGKIEPFKRWPGCFYIRKMFPEIYGLRLSTPLAILVIGYMLGLVRP